MCKNKYFMVIGYFCTLIRIELIPDCVVLLLTSQFLPKDYK